jgi:hypothetical protein
LISCGLRHDLQLADGLGLHHLAADKTPGMEADQALGGDAVGVAQDRKRDAIDDLVGLSEIAEGAADC